LNCTSCEFYLFIYAKTIFYAHICEIWCNKILKIHEYFQNINFNIEFLLNKFLFYMQMIESEFIILKKILQTRFKYRFSFFFLLSFKKCNKLDHVYLLYRYGPSKCFKRPIYLAQYQHTQIQRLGYLLATHPLLAKEVLVTHMRPVQTICDVS